jgi:thiamine-phosphate pyrophosphorylase
MNPVDLRLYLLIGPEHGDPPALVEAARAAVRGGVTLIQYRDKREGARSQVETVRLLVEALSGTGVPVLVNDRVDIAHAAGAAGVHLGQGDLDARDARDILGPRAIVGLTVKNDAHARGLAGAPIDYACIGGVFATVSKRNPDPPVGLSGLAALAATTRAAAPGLPIGAIAGIDATNAASVIGAGAEGIAVISAIMGQADVESAARRLRRIVDQALAARGATA